jgi:transcriptional regulator with XRE-family HTH domain
MTNPKVANPAMPSEQETESFIKVRKLNLQPARKPDKSRSAGRPELERFRQALARLMHERGMSASDLARKIWGATQDSRGYSVARNRDRLTHYLAGTGYPSAPVVQKIASIFNVDPVMLARDETVLMQQHQENHDGDEEKKVAQIGANISLLTPMGGPPLANITLHRPIPLEYANQIIAIYSEALRAMDQAGITPPEKAKPPAPDDPEDGAS